MIFCLNNILYICDIILTMEINDACLKMFKTQFVLIFVFYRHFYLLLSKKSQICRSYLVLLFLIKFLLYCLFYFILQSGTLVLLYVLPVYLVPLLPRQCFLECIWRMSQDSCLHKLFLNEQCFFVSSWRRKSTNKCKIKLNV